LNELSFSPQIRAAELLQLIDRSKIEHLEVQAPDPDGLVDFFSLRKGKPLPKLKSIVIGFGMSQCPSDMVPLIYGLAQMTGELQYVTIHTLHRDRTNNDSFGEAIHRLVLRNPNLKRLYLPHEALLSIGTLAIPKKEKTTAAIDFGAVETAVIKLTGLKLSQFQFGQSWLTLFAQVVSGPEELGERMAWLWQQRQPVSVEFISEIATSMKYLLYNQAQNVELIFRFVVSVCDSFLDYWEHLDGSQSTFNLILETIHDCLCARDRHKLGMAQADQLWRRCVDYIQRLHYLFSNIATETLIRLVSTPGFDIERMDSAWLFEPHTFGGPPLPRLPTRILAPILARHGSKNLFLF
jgi:hypothetical protein